MPITKPVIKIENLSKEFRVKKPSEGKFGAIKSFIGT
jgi:hypothetical protein